MKAIKSSVVFVSFFLLIACCVVFSVVGHSECATVPDQEYLDEENRKYQERASETDPERRMRRRTATATTCGVGCITISLVFHVIHDSGMNSKTSQIATDEVLSQQVDVLNQQYKSSPFTFLHVDTTQTTNDSWNSGTVYAGGNPTDLGLEISGALRTGGRDVLNIYITDGTCTSGSVASFPGFRGLFPRDEYSRNDYVFICPEAISRGADPQSIVIMAHEIGHWLGLLHTFEGESCDPNNPNDFVDDTPQQRSSTNYCVECCEIGRDSCPSSEGNDPVNNYMDYSWCANEFTPGQMQRMYEQFIDYRAPGGACENDEMQIRLEVKFDNNPSETSISYLRWGEDGIVGLGKFLRQGTDVEPNVDFAEKLVMHEMCLLRNTLYEFRMEDRNGLQPPGYFKVFMNGFELPVTRKPVDLYGSGVASFFVAGDGRKCNTRESRWQLELALDDVPNQVSWTLDNQSGQRILDSSVTYNFGQSMYLGNMREQNVYVDKCLPVGQYSFAITDTASPSFAQGYFSLKIGGVSFRKGGGATGFLPTDSADFAVVPPAAPFACFPGRSTVEVLNKGTVRLQDAQIGDLVLVGPKKYERIYSFGHYQHETFNTFLQIRLLQGESPLEMSSDHLIVTARRGAIPASSLAVGDALINGEGNTDAVASIKTVERKGAFAPFTPSGKIVVDGVLVSSFVSLEATKASLSIAGMDISHQWMAHSFEFPHRLVCHYLWRCETESYNDDGISVWVASSHEWALWMLSQSTVVRSGFIALALFSFAAFNLIEVIVFRGGFIPAILLFFVAYRRRHGKETFWACFCSQF